MITYGPEAHTTVLDRPVTIPCGARVRFDRFDRIEDARVWNVYAFRSVVRTNGIDLGIVTRILSATYIEVTFFDHLAGADGGACGSHGRGEWLVEQSVRRSTVLAHVVEIPDALRVRMVEACRAEPWRGMVEKALAA